MTKEQLAQYLIWSGFKYKDRCNYIMSKNGISVFLYSDIIAINIYHNNGIYENSFQLGLEAKGLIENIEYITGEKLVTEVPKPSIKEQLKDCEAGDFVSFRGTDGNTKRGVITFINKDDSSRDMLDIFHIGEYSSYHFNRIKEIIKI